MVGLTICDRLTTFRNSPKEAQMSDDSERIQMTEKGWESVSRAELMIQSSYTVEEAAESLGMDVGTLNILFKIAEVSRDLLEEEIRA